MEFIYTSPFVEYEQLPCDVLTFFFLHTYLPIISLLMFFLHSSRSFFCSRLINCILCEGYICAFLCIYLHSPSSLLPHILLQASRDKKTLDVGANLFIGNLDPDVDEKLLYDTFGAFGVIISTPKVSFVL